jgi:hypothetical protein
VVLPALMMAVASTTTRTDVSETHHVRHNSLIVCKLAMSVVHLRNALHREELVVGVAAEMPKHVWKTAVVWP